MNTKPADFDPESTPFISLGGQLWPISELMAWRELSKCRAQLIELNAKIRDAVAASVGPEGETPEDRADREMGVLSEVFNSLSNEDFDRLVMGPIHTALTAKHPSLTRDELLDWPLTEGERQLAWLTVRRFSGLFVFREPANDNAPDEAADDADKGSGSGEADGAA